MSDHGEDRIDEILTSAGQAWRANHQSARPASMPNLLHLSKRTTWIQGPVGSIAGIALVFVAVVVLAATRPSQEIAAPPVGSATSTPGDVSSASATPRATQSLVAPSPTDYADDDILEPGDHATASGVVIGSDTDGFRICGPEQSFRAEDSQANCGPLSVPVEGVTEATLPGWSEEGHSSYVQITGRWSGTVLVAEGVASIPEPRRAPLTIPCDPPAGAGWSRPTPDGLDGENALRALAEAIEAQPNLFTEYWRADEDPSATAGSSAIVVGTTGDARSAQDELQSLFPYNLCVVHVEYSAAELADIDETIGPNSATWRPRIDWPADRVSIRVVLIDQAASDRVAAYGSAVAFDPLVVKIGN